MVSGCKHGGNSGLVGIMEVDGSSFDVGGKPQWVHRSRLRRKGSARWGTDE